MGVFDFMVFSEGVGDVGVIGNLVFWKTWVVNADEIIFPIGVLRVKRKSFGGFFRIAEENPFLIFGFRGICFPDFEEGFAGFLVF